MSGLRHSIFNRVFFPRAGETASAQASGFALGREWTYALSDLAEVADLPVVVFDLETTGLHPRRDRMIELGAVKVLPGQLWCRSGEGLDLEACAQLESLVDPQCPLSPEIVRITGISDSMLAGAPMAAEVLARFAEFIRGAILVAHNAAFDLSFIQAECRRIGVEFAWPTLCTLRLARVVLSELPRKNLDALAQKYELQFEARHRSLGDAKVTARVLQRLLEEAGDLRRWGDFAPYKIGE